MTEISVRALCAFTAKRGDLDLRFTPAPSALEGIAGHQRVAARRGRHYTKEVPLSTTHEGLTLRGRADGFDSSAMRLDECKTYRGDFARIPLNHRELHTAQLKLYGAMLCRRDGLESLDLALVYLDIDHDRETVLEERYEAQALDRFLTDQCSLYAQWDRKESQRRERLCEQLSQLQFPHSEIRGGQQEFIDEVRSTAQAGGNLLAQAPTGIGKTLGVLFPLLKALAARELDRVFYLTAKTPGRQIALEALAEFAAQPGNQLRVLELIARDKACVNPTLACHPDSCPLARGFYDRLAAAREAALAVTFMDAKVVHQIALQHQICPYYLSHELARWADVIVCDYNYYFDASAMLYALTIENDWRVGLAIDEGHNLLSRARQMYSASLSARGLKAAEAECDPRVRESLESVEHSWRALLKANVQPYAVLTEPPAIFLRALREFVTLAGEVQTQTLMAMPVTVRDFYLGSIQFLRLAEETGGHSFIDLTRQDPAAEQRPTICVRNVIPAPHLKPRFEAAHCAVLFSATLGPKTFNVNVLGLPADTEFLDVDSPFDSDQLKIEVVTTVSTRYAHRQRSMRTIIQTLSAQYERRPGNYLAFFSSFEYLRSAFDQFRSASPEIPAWAQQPRMSERDRESFVKRLRVSRGGIAFAVLGGAFAEGIDLPGDQLVGAFIATLGLPQVNATNEAMRQCLENAFNCGYEYTYLYPGMQKIAQAAGRIIRATSDEGTLILLDDRYAYTEVQELLPRWWRWPRFETFDYAE
ncbi:MAG: ATP-dependent DNA helicase [Povalibacter sp.]